MSVGAIPDGTEIYWDGRHYDLDNVQMQDDVAFYRELASAAGGPVLELACGTGRLTIPCAQTGADVTALDVSEPMLAQARRKLATAGLNIDLHCADCASFRLDKKFDLIFMGFNSLQHIHESRRLRQVLSTIVQHLSPRGRLAFDVLNPDLAFLVRDASTVAIIGTYTDPDTGKVIVVKQSGVYDRAAQVSNQIWEYVDATGDLLFARRFRMRFFFPQELDALLYSHGLAVIEKYGAFDKTPFASESTKQVVVAEPRARRSSW